MNSNAVNSLKTSAGVAAAAAVGPMIWVKDANAQWRNTPEKGAKLRVLRWSRFVQGDIDQYMKNVAKFTQATGVEVRVDFVRLGGLAAADRGGGEHRRRSRHHHRLQRDPPDLYAGTS